MDGKGQGLPRPEAQELEAARAYVAGRGGLTTVGATLVVQLLQDGAGTVPASQGDGQHGAEPHSYYEHKKMATRHVISVRSHELAALLKYSGDEVMKVRMRMLPQPGSNAHLLVAGRGIAVDVDQAFDFALSEAQRIQLMDVSSAVQAQEMTLDFDLVAKSVTVSDLTI